MRDCGRCAWCCYFPTAPELNKPTNEWCKHCDIGKGCSIYKDRPLSCKQFECLWYKQNQIPESLRPDKCGVMFELPDNCLTYVGYADPMTPDAWQEPNVLNLIKKINEAGHSVLIHGEKNYCFVADGMTLDDVKQDIDRAILMYKSEGRI